MNKQLNGYYQRTRPEMLEFIPEGVTRALDVGCASGAFGFQLQQNGIEVVGVEVNDDVAEVAKTLLSKVIVGTLEQALPSLGERCFDIIILNDVLEHMVDPWSTLRTAKTLLTPNGCIIASIPNIRHHSVIHQLLRLGDFRYTEEGILDQTHLRFFTRSSMIRLFEESGYTVDISKGLNPSEIPFKLRLLARLGFANPEELSFLQFGFRVRISVT